MSKITICDLEVFYQVGVGDEERSRPQRLLVTVDMTFDFSSAAVCDRVEKTIDYKAVTDRLLAFGKDRSWKLIEKLAVNIADMVLLDFQPQSVLVEVKKFVIPQARYVSVTCTKSRASRG